MTYFYDLDLAGQMRRMRGLAAQALPIWNIEYRELSLIKYRENAVFRVESLSGERFALRIHRAGYHSDAELLSELQWIDALAEFGMDVPAIVPTPTGELFVVVEGDGIPEARQVDLFEWINGEQLGSVQEGVSGDRQATHQLYRTIGTIAARLHNQSSSWTLPPGFQRHAWDAEGLTGENPFWGRFWELDMLTDDERDLLLQARAQVHQDLMAYGKTADSYSMIHADFVPENLLVDDGIVRVIDFDDAGFGWHLFEIATAIYFLQGEPYSESARDALIEGYRAHRPLSDEQLKHLPLFMTARGFTYLGWIHTRPETPTAQEMGPVLIKLACDLSRAYLSA